GPVSMRRAPGRWLVIGPFPSYTGGALEAIVRSRPTGEFDMPPETRREFTRHALQSLTALALLEGLAAHRLFGADVQPIIDGWLKDLDTISRDVRDQNIKDVEFQQALESLYARVDLPALLRTLDFDRMAAGVNYPARGAKSLPVDFQNVAGLPTKL